MTDARAARLKRIRLATEKIYRALYVLDRVKPGAPEYMPAFAGVRTLEALARKAK